VQQYRSYRFEVRPTPEQRALCAGLRAPVGLSTTRLWRLQRIRVAGGHRRLSYAASCKALAAWKSDPVFVWLDECPSQALQQALKDLDRAFCNFASGRAREPRFKSADETTAFACLKVASLKRRTRESFYLESAGPRIRLSRTVEGVIGSVSVCGRAGGGSSAFRRSALWSRARPVATPWE